MCQELVLDKVQYFFWFKISGKYKEPYSIWPLFTLKGDENR